MRLRFGDFEFDNETGELWQGTTAIHLQPQPARVLALLITQPGELVTREALQQCVWGNDTVVDFEQGLNWCVRRLREVLHDTPSEPRFIQTVPRRGYRFVADVKEPATPQKRSGAAFWWKRYGIIAFGACSILLITMLSGNTTSLGSSYEDVSGVYDTVVIGPFMFRHVWGQAGAVPIVGMEMMRRFTLTFDAKRGLLYLEPNSSFDEPVPSPN